MNVIQGYPWLDFQNVELASGLYLKCVNLSELFVFTDANMIIINQSQTQK